jgi:hypothetical protein
VFEKAQRKVAECTFFLRQLRETQDPDATEFFFNALLNAGKNVVNALRAQVLSCESTRLPSDQATVKAQQAYDRHFKAWERTLTGSHATLFDVLQKLRDIETHADRSGVRHLPKTEERRQPRSVPLDSHYRAIFASYMAMGVLSTDVTVPITSYDLWVDTVAPSKRRVQALFKQFAKGKQKPSAEVATTYTGLLDSLVAYFIAHYACHVLTSPLCILALLGATEMG